MTTTAKATFKILAADKLAEEGLTYIQSQPDAELTSKPGLSEDELAKIVGEYDGMIVRSGVQVTAKVLANPGRLKCIARAGVGVDNIDLDAATDAGILVMNSAEASTISTAEHAFTLIMALARQIGPAYKTVFDGGWDRNKFMGRQLHGKSLGIVGFGRIGQTVAERGLAFGMRVVAYDPFFAQPTAMNGQVRMFTNFEDLLPHADILSFHVPLNDQTKGMLNDATFTKCRGGVMVVNASRGGVIDEEALIRALDSKKCGGAALDVFPVEPPPADAPIRKHPKVLCTPHLGASTVEAQQAVSIGAAESLLAFLRGEDIRGAVNAGGMRMNLDPIQERFVDLSQRMTKLISPMITEGISEVTFELSGSQLKAAAGTIERMGMVGLLASHLDIPLNVVNVSKIAQQRGIAMRTVTTEDAKEGPQLIIQVFGGGQMRRVVGRVYHDLRPRIIEINGYHMDMVPAGHMVLIQNEDRPGMIGMVGTEFGQANVNIADMTISRRDKTALMVLKVDAAPPESLHNRLKHRPGILKVAHVKLPEEKA